MYFFIHFNSDLVKSIQNVKLDMDNSGNAQNVFDSNGDGTVGYKIYTIQKDAQNLSNLVYVEVSLQSSYSRSTLLYVPLDLNN